jgi:hypothetical protein
MTEVDSRFKTARALGLVTGTVAAVAGAWTFADPGLLHGPEAMQGSARGTALVLLALAVPVLLLSLWTASRGSGPALLVAAGALLYVVYNAVLFLFLTPFNAAFLLYVLVLGSALWSVGYLAVVADVWRVGASIARHAPVRGVALYVWVIVGLNAAAWLAAIVPSLRPYPTPLLAGTGVATNAIYVQDLAVWLPLATVAALWLRRRQARVGVLVTAVLVMWVLEAVSVAVDQWFGVRADPGSPVVSLTLVGPFVALAILGLVPSWWMLRSARPAPRARIADRHHEDAAVGPAAALVQPRPRVDTETRGSPRW